MLLFYILFIFNIFFCLYSREQTTKPELNFLSTEIEVN